MLAARWALIVMLFLSGAWPMYDGAHALVTGDYVTPSSGEGKGQLGPWATLVRAAGIEPRSVLMESAFVGLGVLSIVAVFLLVVDARSAKYVAACASVGWLWYLPVGTIFSVLEIGILSFAWRRLGTLGSPRARSRDAWPAEER